MGQEDSIRKISLIISVNYSEYQLINKIQKDSEVIFNLLRTFSISMVTNTDSAMVMGCRLSNTSQSTPLNSGFVGVHLLKCVYRKEVGLKASIVLIIIIVYT